MNGPERNVSFFSRKVLLGATVGAALFFMVVGVIFWGGFNTAMEATNTLGFCISCHEMEKNVYQEYTHTTHFTNRSGVRATCSDCHVPDPWVHKVVRKIKASNELLHKALGTIDTPEKFDEHRLRMASNVWRAMKDTDSRECRNCHDWSSMNPETQKQRSAKQHIFAMQEGQTCIDCHKGIAHKKTHDDLSDEELEAFEMPNPKFVTELPPQWAAYVAKMDSDAAAPAAVPAVMTAAPAAEPAPAPVAAARGRGHACRADTCRVRAWSRTRRSARTRTRARSGAGGGQTQRGRTGRRHRHQGRLGARLQPRSGAVLPRPDLDGMGADRQPARRRTRLPPRRRHLRVLPRGRAGGDGRQDGLRREGRGHADPRQAPRHPGAGPGHPRRRAPVHALHLARHRPCGGAVRRRRQDGPGQPGQARADARHRRAVQEAAQAGCWGSCHHDANGMPDAPAGTTVTKYLAESRTEIAAKAPMGGWDKRKGDAEIAAELQAGQFLDLMRYKAGTGKSEDGYVLADRVMEGGQGVEFTGERQGGNWVVSMKRKLSSTVAGDLSLAAGQLYNIGFAIHDDYTDGRFHHVSLGYKFGLDNEAAEINATRQ
jgi:nitrate/TMAO reductase-like tetraheme cytochrome c subunit